MNVDYLHMLRRIYFKLIFFCQYENNTENIRRKFQREIIFLYLRFFAELLFANFGCNFRYWNLRMFVKLIGWTGISKLLRSLCLSTFSLIGKTFKNIVYLHSFIPNSVLTVSLSLKQKCLSYDSDVFSRSSPTGMRSGYEPYLNQDSNSSSMSSMDTMNSRGQHQIHSSSGHLAPHHGQPG